MTLQLVGGEYRGEQLTPARTRELERTLKPTDLPDLVFEYFDRETGRKTRVRTYRFAPRAVDLTVDPDGSLRIDD